MSTYLGLLFVNSEINSIIKCYEAYHNVWGRIDWITVGSDVFAPVTLYLENWINIVNIMW